MAAPAEVLDARTYTPGVNLSGVWRGGKVAENGRLYARVDLGATDAEASAEGELVKELQGVPVGSMVSLAVSPRVWQGNVFFAIRRVEGWMAPLA